MAGKKRFNTSIFGFKKSDVNAYIERIVREFDQRLKEKDEEISSLKVEVRELKEKYEQILEESSKIVKDKEKIASALIQAQEKAENMINEAKSKAAAEKAKLDEALEAERERIVDVKRELKRLKSQLSDVLSKYGKEIDSIVAQVQNEEELNGEISQME